MQNVRFKVSRIGGGKKPDIAQFQCRNRTLGGWGKKGEGARGTKKRGVCRPFGKVNPKHACEIRARAIQTFLARIEKI